MKNYKVTTMQQMFNGYYSLTCLNLSSFDTLNATYMFRSCRNKKTIYASKKFTTANKSSENLVKEMFWQDYKLVGGMGTVYNSSIVDDLYAHIDGGPSNPGYFTAK